MPKTCGFVFWLTITSLQSFIHAICSVMASKSGDWFSWEPVLQKNSGVGGLCFSWVGIVCLHNQLCAHKAGLVLAQERAGQGCCSCRACYLFFSDEKAVVFAVGRRIVRGFGGHLAGKLHRYPFSSLGDCPFHAKTVGCCLSVLQVTFTGISISKIAV